MNDSIYNFINIIFSKYTFDLEDIANVKHFLKVDEYEIALESLILSCVYNKIPLTEEEADRFKSYIKEYDLKEHSMYVENSEKLFLDYYCPDT